MRKIYLIGMLIVLLCSLSAVSASENVSVSDDSMEIDDGYAISENEEISDTISNESDNSDIDDYDVIIEANDLTTYVGNDTYQFRLMHSDESPIGDVEANISYGDGLEGRVRTDDSGIGTYYLGLDVGDWMLTVSYGGHSATANIKILPLNNETRIAKVVTKDCTATYGDNVKYTVKVLDKSKKPIEGKKVTISIGSKKFNLITDSKGTVTLNVKASSGKYSVSYAVENFKGKNSISVRNRVSFSVLKWGLKGDVTKNKLIADNIPNNKWVKKAVKATKKGLPLIKIEGGQGKTVFMTAGVHGNEISSQVAMMKMINYLTKHPIKGTVYIIPFVNVKAISKKVRFTDNDFNRIAADSGTIPNRIVNLVVDCQADAYADFHTTKPGGAPGQNIVMGSKTPTSCEAMIKYVAKNSKVNTRIYSYAGQQYPGSLFDTVNLKGIPGIICEVKLPHNTITAKTIKTSYKMMKYFLKYNYVI